MRYHWGLGIGHSYSWRPQSPLLPDPLPSAMPPDNMVAFTGPAQENQPHEFEVTHSNIDGITEPEDNNNPNIPTSSEVEGCDADDHDTDLSGEESCPESSGSFSGSGMEDRENEDLGDDWSDEDEDNIDSLRYDMYDD